MEQLTAAGGNVLSLVVFASPFSRTVETAVLAVSAAMQHAPSDGAAAAVPSPASIFDVAAAAPAVQVRVVASALRLCRASGEGAAGMLAG